MDQSLITSLYSTAQSKEKWPVLLDQLHPVVNASSAVLMVVDAWSDGQRPPYQFGAVCSGMDAEKMEIYNEKYSHLERGHVLQCVDSEPQTMVVDPAFRNKAEISARLDVAFAIEELGIFHRFGVRLNKDKAWQDLIAFQYDVNRGNATSEEFARLKPYLPHLAQSIELGRMYDQIRDRYNAVLSMLDHVSIGMMILASDTSVLVCNAYAQAVMSNNPCLAIHRNGKLIVPGKQGMLTAIMENVRNVRVEGVMPKQYLRLGSGEDKTGLLLEFSSVVDGGNETDFTADCTFVLLVDPDTPVSLNEQGISAVYSFTQTEMQIARMLSDGHNYSSIAAVRDRSVDTVKSQIKSIYRKAHTSTRAGFIRRMLSISLPFTDDKPE